MKAGRKLKDSHTVTIALILLAVLLILVSSVWIGLDYAGWKKERCRTMWQMAQTSTDSILTIMECRPR